MFLIMTELMDFPKQTFIIIQKKNWFDIIFNAAISAFFWYNYAALNNLLDVVFPNCSDIRVSKSNTDLDPPDNDQPFLPIELSLLFAS
jgi:hypothetical protein